MNTGRLRAAKRRLRQVSLNGFQLSRSSRLGARGVRDEAAGEVARQRDADRAGGGEINAARSIRHEHSADDRANQDGDEGAGLDQCVAAHQLLRAQMLRQQRVLDRPEESRVRAQQEQTAEQKRKIVRDEPDRSHRHDRDFQQLDQAHDARALVLVGELTGGGREQEEGQDQDAAAEIDEHLRTCAGHARRMESDEQHQRVLEQVVVERAEQLRDEERPEAARGEELKLVGCLHEMRKGLVANESWQEQ